MTAQKFLKGNFHGNSMPDANSINLRLTQTKVNQLRQ